MTLWEDGDKVVDTSGRVAYVAGVVTDDNGEERCVLILKYPPTLAVDRSREKPIVEWIKRGWKLYERAARPGINLSFGSCVSCGATLSHITVDTCRPCLELQSRRKPPKEDSDSYDAWVRAKGYGTRGYQNIPVPGPPGPMGPKQFTDYEAECLRDLLNRDD